MPRWRRPDKPQYLLLALLSGVLVVLGIIDHRWWRVAICLLWVRIAIGQAWNWTSSRLWPRRSTPRPPSAE